jgi:Bacterial type III secretion protein (HrpB7)
VSRMSAFNWRQLVQVREQQRNSAIATVADDRRALDNSIAAALQAEQGLQQERQGKTDFWASTVHTPGGVSVAQLQHAGAWNRVLNQQIAQAANQVAAARQAELHRQQVLAASRERLQRTSAGLEKANQALQRHRHAHARLQERRHDDHADDHAVQSWQQQTS